METIELEMSEEEYALLEAAANSKGLSIEDFILNAAIELANELVG